MTSTVPPLAAPTPVRALRAVTAADFHGTIVPAAQPVILRGLVSHWPVVQAAAAGDEALFAHLSAFDQQQSVTTLVGDPEAGGRFFYNADLTGFNFRSGGARLQKSFDFLLANRDAPSAAALAVQSIATHTHLPGFGEANPSPVLDPAIEPRLWIGNRVIIAAHQDPYENLACVVAGRRRFTLFPPSSVGDLYIGPFELTPGGPTISLVSFDDPDLERHPRFARAMESALVAELEPGDALYIPYLWWHHVRSLAPVNVLTNYWWAASTADRGAPHDALLQAILALRDLPDSQRVAWKTLFDHYVFGDVKAATDHLPVAAQGLLGALTPEQARRLRETLGRQLLG
ncbi:MAG: cupin-like domain-containing protein [Alphaproteobacteria bacterium]|nr:cupin-like domain-containing protein [Alphaproteobacteria bacterium]